MNEDTIQITGGSGNVFLDLGFDLAEAEVMKLRAEVMIRTVQQLKAQGWTQAEAARHLGITRRYAIVQRARAKHQAFI